MSYKRLVNLTLGAVYFLILVGGVVRSTGSGMGCPDWPKCFGQWIPPVSVEELPSDYKEMYSSYRHNKNLRFAGFLEKIGMTKTAQQLRSDEMIKQEADFNAVKTWIEYVNRIVGMVVGLLVAGVFAGSVSYFKMNKGITIAGACTLVTVAFTAWFGSIVVSTNLTPWTVTLHMALALVTVALLVYIRFLIGKNERPAGTLFLWVNVALILTVNQIFLGTQVRESVDEVAVLVTDRWRWIELLGVTFIIHRSFSWLLLGINGFIAWKLYQSGMIRHGLLLLLITLASLLTGAGMAWFGVPAFLQPLHLLFASLLFGTQFALWLHFRPAGILNFKLQTS